MQYKVINIFYYFNSKSLIDFHIENLHYEHSFYNELIARVLRKYYYVI